MTWWPFKRKRNEEDMTVSLPDGGTSLADAQFARSISQAGLRHARARDTSVREAAERQRSIRTENHLAETITAAMRLRG